MGPIGRAAMVRIDWRNGETYFYEGEMGAERVVRTDFPSGNKPVSVGALALRGANHLGGCAFISHLDSMGNGVLTTVWL